MRVTCPRCGDMAVPVEVVIVSRGEGGDFFRFHCELCFHDVEKKAVGRVADMLLAAGARRFMDPASPPPLTVDDVDALRTALNAPDWMDRLLLA